MELLAAYIRANSPLTLVPTEGRNPTLSTHVNAALSAFRRREWRRESREQKLIFEKSYLYDANFGRTHLAGAFFDASYLRAAYFCGADLPDAVFSNANLEFADFREANLRKARFDRANIRASDFSTAANLVPEQVRAATGWDQALYPQELVRQLQLPTDHNTKIATRFT